MDRREQKMLAVDWIHAAESGFFIVCDRCRALPFLSEDVWRARGRISGAIECGEVFVDQFPAGIARGEGVFDAGADAGDQFFFAA